ncbi:MAG: DNA gyrase subunit A [Oceanospirillales bacterium]|jgi:DNA gyrase subunit A|nr:DNA gyrase subunit A [Oceanospirillales bacterium]
MSDSAREILPINIEDELKNSYLDYAMSVIVGRALPDVRDGLKPVHRRVLFAQSELSNNWNAAYKKSARVVGDVIGKYHPHGDSAVYDTIVRLAQPFSMRYPLIDGQGNFGSVDGDRAAAMRYTEIRMERIAHELLADLDKDTVDYVPNYDGTEKIPDVLPTKIPNLLVNGSAGIAVGMATNIPPHNLTEVINGCLAYLDDSNVSVDDLMALIPAPDFPTGALINGLEGLREAYSTGRGRVIMRSKFHIEGEDKKTIVFTEIPYQVNKARVIEKIAELVKEKKIEGITELRDESDKEGMRIVIDLRRGETPEVIVNNLFSQTQLQSSFGINMVALVDGQPKTLNLKDMLACFIRHRREVVTRRTLFELRKARERGHILEGQAVALANIDPVIELIKSSANAQVAKERLIATSWAPGSVTDMLERAGTGGIRPDDLPDGFGLVDGQYHLSPQQAQAILDLRLHRLTGLEIEKLLEEYGSILEDIAEREAILADSTKLTAVIREELEAVRHQYGDARRSEIIESHLSLSTEDLIPREDMVVTFSKTGYAKTQPLTSYQSQRRGGRGKSATNLKDEDVVDLLLVANSHDTLLLFTDTGRLHWLKVYEIPQASRNARGKPIVNMIDALEGGGRVTAVLPLGEDDRGEGRYVFMATARGTVKKVPLERFARPRASGIRAIEFNEDDTLIGASITDGTRDIVLVNSNGKVTRFVETEVRPMGREARGVRGIRLKETGESVVAMIVADDEATLLLACENGYGKRTLVSEFPCKGRGAMGVIGIQTSDRNGAVVGAAQVIDDDDLLLITNGGTMVRTPCQDISVLGRNTQGVTLIRLTDGEQLVRVDAVAEPPVEPLSESDTDDGEIIDGSDVEMDDESAD